MGQYITLICMNSIVISIGGSVLISDDVDFSYYNKLSNLIKKFSKKYKTYVVVGGGKTARRYINLGRYIGLEEKELDEIGIEATRLNAKFLSLIVKDSNKKIPSSTDEAKKLENSIVIMGGTIPGHSTDLVGAELACKTKASKYIIATNVDGIYTKDPDKFKDAKKIDEIKIEKLIEKYGVKWNKAGKNMVVDGPALDMIYRKNISTFVLNGKKLNELENALNNKPFNGTKIKR